jgi:hypothetical protein
MIGTQPCILYSLPKSNPAQAIAGKKIENVWNKVELFLNNCTTANSKLPLNIELFGYSADIQHNEDSILANEKIANALKVFGEGKITHVSYQYPSGIPSEQVKIEWSLETSDLHNALNFMINEQPQPKYNFGPLELMLSYNFKLIDPVSKIELPGQELKSNILIWLSRLNSVNANIWFPFKEVNDEFLMYTKSIESYFPFKFNIKYLKLARPNNKGTAYIFKKAV